MLFCVKKLDVSTRFSCLLHLNYSHVKSLPFFHRRFTKPKWVSGWLRTTSANRPGLWVVVVPFEPSCKWSFWSYSRIKSMGYHSKLWSSPAGPVVCVLSLVVLMVSTRATAHPFSYSCVGSDERKVRYPCEARVGLCLLDEDVACLWWKVWWNEATIS